MGFDIRHMSENKMQFRKRLAALPIEEKLAKLDVLRERTLSLRKAKTGMQQQTRRAEAEKGYVGRDTAASREKGLD